MDMSHVQKLNAKIGHNSRNLLTRIVETSEVPFLLVSTILKNRFEIVPYKFTRRGVRKVGAMGGNSPTPH